ncbi:MAG: hypothetical protein LUG58_00440 [Clostridiales bacterium]|nr:hypothetical protein [Clostridiales bacterium]
MSVPEGKRGQRKMEVFTKANDLAIYTIKICSNQKVFLPEYQSAMTDDIIATAKDIFLLAWEANSIRVTDGNGQIDPAKRRERKDLQERAIRKCNKLLALMQMAQRLFHLKTKRIKYWGQKTVDVRNLLKSWKESDTRRYADQKQTRGNNAPNACAC